MAAWRVLLPHQCVCACACTAPVSMNDDWYWLHAAVASGAQCRVVSNDELRDHHFAMMGLRAFLHWKERHIVHFDFDRQALSSSAAGSSGDGTSGNGSDEGGGGAHASVTARLRPPRRYTHVMQESDGGVWHVPCVGETHDEWVCLYCSNGP